MHITNTQNYRLQEELKMKFNKWTLALASVGAISLGVHAEEQHQLLTALSSTTISGYVEASAMWKPGTSGTATAGDMPGRTFDNGNRADGFNLHAVKLTLEKPLDEGQWSAGYKADLIFGPDADYYSSAQNFGTADGGDFAVKQAYVALRAPVGNGIDIKLGVFDTIVGYEVFESGNNPNFSRSYGYALEPTHHTGVLASYHIVDAVSVSAGVANTYTGPVNARAARSSTSPVRQTEKTYMGSVTVTLPESTGAFAGTAIYGGVVDGLSAGGAANAFDTTSYYAGLTLPLPVKGLSIGAAYDYRDDGANFLKADNRAYSIAGYVTFQASEKLKINGRVDYLNADDGTFYDGKRNFIADQTNHLLASTLTVDYSLWSNVLTRLEGRWDHDLGNDHAFDGGSTFGGGLRNNAFTLALDMIYKF
jgi:hypothetical protein